MDIFVLGLHFICVILSFFFIRFVAYQKKSSLCNYLLLYSIAVLVNGLSYLFELKSGTIEEALMAIRFEYFGLSTATISALLFICELFNVKLKKWIRGIVVLAFFWSCIMVVTNEYHHLHYVSMYLEVREHVAIFRSVTGPHYITHTVITLASLGVCVGVIIYAWVRDLKKKDNYKKYLFLALAAMSPMFCWVAHSVGLFKDFDLIPFGLFCTNAFFILILYFFRIFDVAENAKNDVLETMEEGILVCDEEGHVVYFNPSMQAIFPGVVLKEIYDIISLMVPTVEGEFLIGNRYFAVTESEVYERERVTGKTWCFIDMTQTREREKQLKELTQEATAANNAKSNFLANMSHEIRTPINTILGMDELILREAQNLNVLEYARNIESEGRTLLSLINDLLDFSKIESGRMELADVEYKSSDMVHDVVTMFSLKAKEKGLEFHVDVADDLPAAFYGDEVRIKQILSNLLSNAVKYTERGEIGFRVEWEPVADNRALISVTVKDSGIGIRKEDMDGVFEKFKRLDSKRNNRIEGTGLGMNITAQLLKMMDGDITIRSEYGIGSEFMVKIPQVIADASPIGKGDFDRTEVKREEVRITFTAPDAKILVVDDNIMNRVVVKGLLKHTLLQIDEAESGTECLEKTKDTRYDIILLDHMMPGMDGVETLKLLKKQEGACVNVPVIVLTANAVAGVRDFYLEQGFDDYMSKPISGARLEEMLLQYLAPSLVLTREDTREWWNVQNKRQEGFRPEEIRSVLAIERIDLRQGLENMNGDKQMYRTSARVFASLCDSRLRTLHECIRREDVPAYTALVHAIKGDARTLGANELAEVAWEQEKMGKEGNLTFLLDKFGLLSAEYRRIAECLGRLFEQKDAERSE